MKHLHIRFAMFPNWSQVEEQTRHQIQHYTLTQFTQENRIRLTYGTVFQPLGNPKTHYLEFV